MLKQILAKADLENWIKIIIFVLIIGGSVIKAILNAIIKKFTPQEEDPKSKSAGRVKIDKPFARPMQPAQPLPPAARPRPGVSLENPTPKPKPKLELPVELPEILADIFPDIVASRKPKDQRPRPPAKPKPAPKQSRRVVRSRSTQKPVPKPRTPVEAEPVRRTTEERLGTLTSSFDNTDELLEHVETRIEPGMDPHPGSEDLEKGHVAYDIPIPVDEFKAGVFHVDRTELRRAIVLKEILSPPLALREFDV